MLFAAQKTVTLPVNQYALLNTIMVRKKNPRGNNERDKDFVNVCSQEETIDVDFKTVALNASLLTISGGIERQLKDR